MPCRDAVHTILSTDPVLITDFGINQDFVFHNADLDIAPRNGPFLVLRWEETTTAYGRVGSEQMTVWAHVPRQVSTDYAALVAILNRVTTILLEAIHVAGVDGVLSTATYQGMSPDFNDEVLKTISKNASFSLVSRAPTVE